MSAPVAYALVLAAFVVLHVLAWKLTDKRRRPVPDAGGKIPQVALA